MELLLYNLDSLATLTGYIGFVLYCVHGDQPAYVAVMGCASPSLGVIRLGSFFPRSVWPNYMVRSAGGLYQPAGFASGIFGCWIDRPGWLVGGSGAGAGIF